MERRFLTVAEVVELAELLADATIRVGMVDQVLEAAAAGRGMTLVLQPGGRVSRRASEPKGDQSVSGSRQ